MATYTLMTDKNLIRQELFLDGAFKSLILNPVNPIDQRLISRVRSLVGEIGDQYPQLMVGYDGTKAFPSDPGGSRVPVSYGHLLLSKVLSDNPNATSAKHLVDLGCGTGLVGNHAAKNFEGLKDGKVTFADMSPSALNAALQAYMINNQLSGDDVKITDNVFGFDLSKKLENGEQTIDFRLGNALQTLSGIQADVAVSAPLYLPGLIEVFPQAYHVFGTVAKMIGADLYVAHSSMADGKLEEAAHSLNLNLTDLESRTMPLTFDFCRMPEGKIQQLESLGMKITGDSDSREYTHDMKVSKLYN